MNGREQCRLEVFQLSLACCFINTFSFIKACVLIILLICNVVLAFYHCIDFIKGCFRLLEKLRCARWVILIIWSDFITSLRIAWCFSINHTFTFIVMHLFFAWLIYTRIFLVTFKSWYKVFVAFWLYLKETMLHLIFLPVSICHTLLCSCSKNADLLQDIGHVHFFRSLLIMVEQSSFFPIL